MEVSKACLQAPLPFPPPQATARLASLGDILPIWPRFLPFPPLWNLVSGYIQQNIDGNQIGSGYWLHCSSTQKRIIQPKMKSKMKFSYNISLNLFCFRYF